VRELEEPVVRVAGAVERAAEALLRVVREEGKLVAEVPQGELEHPQGVGVEQAGMPDRGHHLHGRVARVGQGLDQVLHDQDRIGEQAAAVHQLVEKVVEQRVETQGPLGVKARL
jgi:hypothetical protein